MSWGPPSLPVGEASLVAVAGAASPATAAPVVGAASGTAEKGEEGGGVLRQAGGRVPSQGDDLSNELLTAWKGYAQTEFTNVEGITDRFRGFGWTGVQVCRKICWNKCICREASAAATQA